MVKYECESGVVKNNVSDPVKFCEGCLLRCCVSRSASEIKPVVSDKDNLEKAKIKKK